MLNCISIKSNHDSLVFEFKHFADSLKARMHFIGSLSLSWDWNAAALMHIHGQCQSSFMQPESTGIFFPFTTSNNDLLAPRKRKIRRFIIQSFIILDKSRMLSRKNREWKKITFTTSCECYETKRFSFLFSCSGLFRFNFCTAHLHLTFTSDKQHQPASFIPKENCKLFQCHGERVKRFGIFPPIVNQLCWQRRRCITYAN